MKLIFVTDDSAWDVFQRAHSFAQFTQSNAWRDYRFSQSCPIERVAIVDDAGTWIAACQLEYRARRFGLGYWFAARGPVFASDTNDEICNQALAMLREELLTNPKFLKQSLFVRLEPVLHASLGWWSLSSFVPVASQNPSTTLLVDLSKTETELLREMHEKTRYNIRVAAKHDVKIRESNSEADLEIFLELLRETSARDGFVQPASWIENLFRVLVPHGLVRVRLAEYQGVPLAGSVEIVYGDTVTYLYGASSSKERSRMAPYALHWDAIVRAKGDGARYYDLWGMNPSDHTHVSYKPSWVGISRFKKGFGGEERNFVGTVDLPQKRWLYRIAFLFR